MDNDCDLSLVIKKLQNGAVMVNSPFGAVSSSAECRDSVIIYIAASWLDCLFRALSNERHSAAASRDFDMDKT